MLSRGGRLTLVSWRWAREFHRFAVTIARGRLVVVKHDRGLARTAPIRADCRKLLRKVVGLVARFRRYGRRGLA